MQQVPFKLFLDTQNILSGMTTPKLHIEVCDWLDTNQKSPRKIMQVFRHAGKSYILCCYVAWKLLTDPNYTCIIVSAKKALAMRNSMMIRSIIETNPLTQHLKSDLYQWQSSQFTVERDSIQLNPSVTCTSMASSFTGMHADEIIGDDIEVATNVLTEDARNFIKDRVMEFGKIAKRILLTGTPHHEETIYRHVKSVGYDCEIKIPVYNKDSELAWPNHPDGMFTWDWLERQKAESTEGDFRSQYMLVPSKTYDSLIDIDKIQTYEAELTYQHLPQPMGGYLPIVRIGDQQINRLVSSWDVASGLRGRDASVLSVCARDSNGYVYVHDVVELSAAKDKDFDVQCEEVINICDKYKLGHVYLEENFSMTLKAELKRKILAKKKKIVVIGEFRNVNKLNFMAQQLEPIIKVGKMRVHKRVLNNSKFMSQLEEFPYMRHDDCIDATAMAISKLPEPAVDISKIPLIQSPLQFAGGRAKLTD
tara:strand:+ start:5573 stop:7006 length:1434 start_codon:yes stop_codon:yes gene_type:complete